MYHWPLKPPLADNFPGSLPQAAQLSGAPLALNGMEGQPWFDEWSTSMESQMRGQPPLPLPAATAAESYQVWCKQCWFHWPPGCAGRPINIQGVARLTC